jgi:hypothetical protein
VTGWIVQEASGLLAVTAGLIIWFGGAYVIAGLTNWMFDEWPRGRHVRGKDQLRKVYRRNRPGYAKVYVLKQAPVKVIEGRKN